MKGGFNAVNILMARRFSLFDSISEIIQGFVFPERSKFIYIPFPSSERDSYIEQSDDVSLYYMYKMLNVKVLVAQRILIRLPLEQ